MAKVLGLKLENFKSFKSLDLPIPKGFTAIVGPNGSGKCLLGDTLISLNENEKISFEKLFENIEKNYQEKKLENETEILIPKEKIFVLSLNLKSLKIEKKEILAISRRKEKNYAILKTKEGKYIKATLTHPFFIKKDNKIVTKPLKFLSLQDKILVFDPLQNIKEDQIEKIQIEKNEVYVYDIQVKDNSNFFANEILVHNSNIVDAFCFVLGKGSSKLLRGKSFKDLITLLPKRPKEGKVTIFFSLNEKETKKLNSQSQILAIERKVFLDKDETSYRIYHINLSEKEVFDLLKEKKGDLIFESVIKKRKISKTEALDIFSKLNMPSQAFNIIQQGDLLKIISMTNLERRKVIDEISGIWEFEEKKEKALEELKLAREYLEKIEVRLAEVRSLLDHLKKEVEKLEKYENIKRKLGILNQIYFLRLYIFYKNRILKFKSLLEEKYNLLKNIEEKLCILEKQKKENLENLKNLELDIQSFKEGDYKSIFEIASKLKAELEVLKEEIENLKSKIDESNKKILELEAEYQNLTSSKINLEEEIKKLKNNLQSLLDEIKNLEEERKKKSTLYLEFSKKLDEISEKEKIFLEKKAKIAEEIHKITYNLDLIKKEIKQKKKDIENLKQEKQKLLSKLEKLKNEKFDIKEIIDELESLKEKEFEVKEKLENLKNIIQKLELEREKLLRKYIEEEAKIKNLERYSLSHDKVIEIVLNSNLPGIIGIVGDLGKTALEYKTALEASAAGRLNFIVVDTFENVKKVIEFVKRNNLPRLTFLPLDTIRYRETPKIDHPKIIGRAIDLIEFEEKYRPIFEFVFHGTYIVKNLEDARELFEIYPNFRFVTLEGDILEPSGAVSGGKIRTKAQISVKIDYSTLKNLKEKLKNLSEDLQAKKQEYEKLKAELTNLEKKEFSLKHHLKELEKRKQENSQKLESIKEKLENIDIKIFSLEKDIEKLLEKEKYYEGLLKEKKEIFEKILKEIESINKEKEKLKNHEILKTLSNLEKTLEDKKSLYEKMERNFQDKSLKLEKLILKLEDIQEKLQNLKEEKKLLEQTLELKLKLYENKEKEYNKYKLQLSKLEEKLKLLEEKRKEQKEKLRKIENQIDATLKEKEKIKDEIFKFEKEVEKTKVQIEELKKNYPKLELYLDISSKKEIENILVSQGYKNEEFCKYLDIDLSQLEETIKNLKTNLNLLGAINFQAKKDYEEVYQRHKDLIEKWEIYKKEEEKYLNLLNEIEERKKEIFMETFNKIRNSFREIYEKFGGKGDIILENEKDPFKGGIIIKATPKGKKLINMNAMSGGEKALAALSFIFAIAKLFDTPIYVLDEVDAPLDVKNASLVGKLIKDSSKEKDFLVISHREQTISSADNVYGVVMENGLSKVVGIKV